MTLRVSNLWSSAARRALLSLACGLLLAPVAAEAQSTPGGSVCSAPLERLQALASARPDSAAGHAELGRCYLALGRTDIAYEAFQRAAELDPTADRKLDVAVALYHARKLNEAEANLDRLADVIPDRADLHFYKGLILLERGEEAKAAERLDHSRRLSPGRVEPVASYFAGVSFASAGDLARAEEALQRVARDWEGSQWGSAAEAELARLHGTWGWKSWVEAEIGLLYDSNVSVTGRSVSPAEISDHDDFATTHAIRGGREVSDDNWYAGAGVSYLGSAHFDLTDFDVMYPSITAYGFHKLGNRNGARLQLDAGYAWLGNDPFVFTYDSTFALTHNWGADYGATEWFVDFLVRDYRRPNRDVPGPGEGVNSGVCPPPSNNTFPIPDDRGGQCGPPGIDEASKRNRDGIGIRTGFGHSLPTPKPLTRLRLVGALERYDSEGSEYEYDGVEAGLDARFDIAFGLTGRLRSTYRARWYDHPSTYPDAIPAQLDVPPAGPINDVFFPYALSSQKRREHLVAVSARLERELLYDLSIALKLNYDKRFSNTQVFEYSRFYGGVLLTWRPNLNK